jgi:hypothetical protein
MNNTKMLHCVTLLTGERAKGRNTKCLGQMLHFSINYFHKNKINLYEIVTLSNNYWLSLTYMRLLLCPTTIGCRKLI